MADTYTVERSALIEATPEQVYPKIADFHEWQAWSPWEGMDPDQQRTYSGADSGSGAVYSWSGNRKVGEGRMEITHANEASRVEIALDFIKPFKSSNTTSFSLQPEGAGTRVDWSMTGPKTLMTKVMGIFKSMDKMIGPDFERGLAQLKSQVEQT
jgi:hypothetical protein